MAIKRMIRNILVMVSVIFMMTLAYSFVAFGAEQLIMKPSQSWIPEGMDKSQIGLVEFVRNPSYLANTGYQPTGCTADANGKAMIYSSASRGGGNFLMVVIPDGCDLYFNPDSSHMFDGFGYCRLEHLDLVKSDLLHNTSYMFRGCTGLMDADLCMNTTNVIEYTGMFEGCTNITGVRKSDCFMLMDALPSSLRYYEGFTEAGKNGLSNTELPKTGSAAYVTDMSKRAYLKYAWKATDGTDRCQYQMLSYSDAGHLIMPTIQKHPGVNYNWVDPQTGATYTAGQDLGCIRDNQGLSWHTLLGI